MAYIGNQVSSVLFAVNTFSGDGAATNFGPMDRAPAGPPSVAVFVNGLYKTPTTDYTISGVEINFTTAPVAGTNNIVIHHLGNGVMSSQVPSDGTVTTPKLAQTLATNNFRANTTLRTPVYTDNATRDISITSPVSGLLVISGTQFQGYDGSGWVVLNN